MKQCLFSLLLVCVNLMGAALLTIARAAPGTIERIYSVGGPVYSSPAIGSEGQIYAGSEDGKLYEFATDGRTNRVWNLDSPVFSSPAIGCDGTIYIGSYSGLLYACKSDGSTSHVWGISNFMKSHPALASDGMIYYGVLENLYKLNPNGTTNNIFQTPFETGSGVKELCSATIASDGTVYAASPNYLYEFFASGATGRVWKISDQVQSSPVIGKDGRLYLSAYRFFAKEHGLLVPVDYYRYLYVFYPDGSTGSYNQFSGTFTYEFFTAPVVGADGTVYAGTGAESVQAFDYDLTECVAEWSTSGKVRHSPAVGSDGTIYAGCDQGLFYAFAPDGSTNFVVDLGAEITAAPVLDTSGVVYVCCADNNIYAIQGTGGGYEESSWSQYRCNLENTGAASFPPVSPVPAYRFYSAGAPESTYTHLWTINETERDVLMTFPSWQYEGIGWYALTNRTSGSVPLFRLYEPNIRRHLYTISITEYVALEVTSWNGEDAQYFVYPEKYIPGLVPVYRFYHSANQNHHFTIDENEKNKIIATPEWGYTYEGIGFYVFPEGPASLGPSLSQ